MEIKYFQTRVKPGKKKNSYWRWCKLGIKKWKWWMVIKCRRAASQHNKLLLLKVMWHAHNTVTCYTSIFLLQAKHSVEYKILHDRLKVHHVMNIMTTVVQQVTMHSPVDWWHIPQEPAVTVRTVTKKECHFIPSSATQTSQHPFQYQQP